MAKRRPIDEIIKDASNHDKVSKIDYTERRGLIYANDKASHDDVSDYGFKVTIDTDNYLDSVERIKNQIEKTNRRLGRASELTDDMGKRTDNLRYVSGHDSTVTVMGFDDANAAATYGCSVGNQILENMDDFDHWVCHEDKDEAHIADVFNTKGEKVMTLNLVYDYERQGQATYEHAEPAPEDKSESMNYVSWRDRFRDLPVIEPDDEPGYEPGYEL